MMNIAILWCAYEETDRKKYYDIAYMHSKRTIEEFIRSDYSTIHVIDFDLVSGKIIRKITIQGYSDDSCWSRGQAWAIYGFTLAYKTTKDRMFLEIEKTCGYFIINLPDDYIPCWDFKDPTLSVKDSSAAAIASSALLTLSKQSGDRKLEDISLKILNSLLASYFADNSDGILKHGCFHKPAGIDVDESLIWGDYYFVESLAKKGRDHQLTLTQKTVYEKTFYPENAKEHLLRSKICRTMYI